MYPLNDNDLDRLSREAADQYDVQPRTSGWEALEHRLNKELPLKEDKERRRFLFWLFLIVVLAGGGVLWTMTGNDRPATIQLTGSNTMPDVQKKTAGVDREPVAAAGQKDGKAVDNNEGGEQGQQTSGQPAITNKNATATDGTSNISPKPKLDSPADGSISKNSDVTGKKQGNTSEKKRTGPRIDKAVAKQTSINQVVKVGEPLPFMAGTMPFVQNNPIANAHEQHTIGWLQPSADYKEPQPSLVQGPDIMAGKPGTIPVPPLEPVIENKQAPARLERIRQPHGLEVGIQAGPDMSNIRFTDVDKVGYNVGLQVAYRFNNRWSVNTGFSYTRKNYTAQGKDFTKPVGNYWDNADVKKVAGDCVMFDIPLNVRYDLSIQKKTRWFVSAGASSYIMTNQNYTVNYLYNGMPRTYPHEDYATSTYLFSIVNFSAGFETKLNRRLSLQAEPYFKLPTKGLGYGKLDLNSYGLYFALRYQLHK